jgi:hypothetical protein
MHVSSNYQYDSSQPRLQDLELNQVTQDCRNGSSQKWITIDIPIQNLMEIIKLDFNTERIGFQEDQFLWELLMRARDCVDPLKISDIRRSMKVQINDRTRCIAINSTPKTRCTSSPSELWPSGLESLKTCNFICG